MRFHLKLSSLWAAAGLLIGLSVAPSWAETQVYNCGVGQRSNSYYQPEALKVTVDADRWLVRVEDDLTRKVQQGPIVGKIDTQNDKRLTVTWIVPDVPRDPRGISPTFGNPKLFQRLTIRPDGSGTLTGDISWGLPGNHPQIQTTVTCKRHK